MSRASFSDEVKLDATAQISERGYSASEISKCPCVNKHSLNECKTEPEAAQSSSYRFRRFPPACRILWEHIAFPIR